MAVSDTHHLRPLDVLLGGQGTSLPDLGPGMVGLVQGSRISLGQQNRRKEMTVYTLRSSPSPLLCPP